MKILHISDLHIGKTVNAFSMLEDQEHVLAQVLGYVGLHRPDAVVIAGDVYDKLAPPPDAVRVFDRFITELAGMGPEVMIVSGNHDSPERLGFASGIMKERGVHIYGVFDGKMRVAALRDGYGEVRFYMLPFIRPADARRYYGGEGDTADSYQDAVSAIIGAAGIDVSARNVLIAHQFFASESADPERTDSERETVGGTDRIDVEACGITANFDYAAFGHLHRSQRAGPGHVRYAGSPLKYSLSECFHDKCALLVELRGKGELSVEALPLKPLRDMRRIRGRIDALLEEARSGADDLFAGTGKNDYLHVILTDEDEVYDAIGKLRAVFPNVMKIEYDNSRSNAGPGPDGEISFEDATPLSLFEDFYESQNGAAMSADQKDAVSAFLNPELLNSGSELRNSSSDLSNSGSNLSNSGTELKNPMGGSELK